MSPIQRFALYARTATDSEPGEAGLDAQRAAVEDFVRLRGWRTVAPYADTDAPGPLPRMRRPAADRPTAIAPEGGRDRDRVVFGEPGLAFHRTQRALVPPAPSFQRVAQCAPETPGPGDWAPADHEAVMRRIARPACVGAILPGGPSRAQRRR